MTTIFQLAINDAYELVGRNYRPPPISYTEHQLFLNPYVHAYMIYKFAREFLQKKEYVVITAPDRRSNVCIQKNKNPRGNAKRINVKFMRCREDKDVIINQLKEDLLYLYKFGDNIYLKEFKEISKLYDSNCLKLIGDSIRKYYDSDFELESLEWVVDDEHPFKEEFIERTNRFYNNLTRFQMEMPLHILKLIELLLSKDFPEMKIKHNLDKDVELNLEYIMKQVQDYFGTTLNIYFTLKPSDVYYDVPTMDFIEDYKVYKLKF